MIKFKASLLLALVVLLALSCQKEIKTGSQQGLTVQSNSEVCGTPMVKTLMDAGGVLSMGIVTISNDGSNIFIKIDADAGQVITRIGYVAGSKDHVTDGIMLPSIFYTACEGPGTPDDVHTFTIASATTSHTITLPASMFQEDDCIWIGLNVSTNNADGTMELCGGVVEFDEMFGSADYQSGFQYCKQECPPEDCGPLRTQTPGGWGAPANGNNPGAYLTANFDDAFGDFITVGCYPGDFYIKLTSAQAIINLLPTGGQAKKLTANATDPASIQNVLVGHLVALTLSVGFDEFDADFGAGGVNLGDMVIGSGTFEGWTVSAFLEEANKVLGGCSTTYTIQQVLTTASAINENYVDGKIDLGCLECPNAD